MNGAPALLSRTVVLRSASGQPLVRVGVVPAAVAVAAGLALAPRATAVAGVIALFRRLSLSLDGGPAELDR